MINLGVIGAGTAFWNLHFPVLKSRDDIEISTVFSRSLSRANEACEKIRGEGGGNPKASEDLFDVSGLDAVLITVPIGHNEEYCARYLELGLHVFCEKPIAETVEGAKKLLSCAIDRNVSVLAGENFRLQPRFAEVARLVQTGIIGEPRLYFLNDLHFTAADGIYAKTSWRVTGEHKGGYLIDGGSHIVAGMREMLGRRAVKSVSAVSTETQSYLSAQSDTLLINLLFEDGLVGHLALGYGVFDHEARTPKVYGRNGTLSLEKDGIYLVNGDGHKKVENIPNTTGFSEEWSIFCSSILESDYSTCYELTQESIEDLRIIQCAIRAAETNSIVSIKS